MILYIPTCSLNINNILSTDSISPAALYATRSTGNKRFFPVEACPSDQAIFLYSKVPSYKMEVKDLENYRVVIVIDANKIGQVIKKIGTSHGIDVYICESTIYINPFNAYFSYPSKNAYQSCASLAEQSLENKTFFLYKHRGINTELEFKWDKSYCKKYQPTKSPIDSSTDTLIDGIKGAIVGYYAGLKMMKSAELAILKKDARKIRNYFSALSNSSIHHITEEQDKNLTPIVKEFSDTFSRVDPITRNNKITIESYISKTGALDMVDGRVTPLELMRVIDKLNLTKYLMKLLNLVEPFDIYSLYDIIGSNQFADLLSVKIADMNHAISRIEVNLSSTNKIQIVIPDKFHVKDGKSLSINDNHENDFYNAFINSLINKKHLQDPDKTLSLSIALLGGQILRSLYSEKEWNKSSSRVYINALLNNIQNGTPFDIISDNNDILQALAVFSLKGSDIDKMTDIISQNGISEYKYSWGLFGAASGYSMLPKTFTNNILTDEVLLDVYKLLFPEQVLNCVEDDTKGKDIDTSMIQDIEDAELNVSNGSEVHDYSSIQTKRIEIEKDKLNHSDLSAEFEKKLRSIHIGGKSLQEKQIKILIENFKSSGERVDESFINRIKKVRGIGDKLIKAIRDCFSVQPVAEKTLFDNQLWFVKDEGLTDLVKGLHIGDPKVEEIIISDIKYLQDVHKKDSNQDNYECIDHLQKLLFMKNGKHLQLSPINKQRVEMLIKELKTRYSI